MFSYYVFKKYLMKTI